MPMGAIYKAPFMADAGDTERNNIIYVKKKWENSEQWQLNQKKQNHRDHNVSHGIAEVGLESYALVFLSV